METSRTRPRYGVPEGYVPCVDGVAAGPSVTGEEEFSFPCHGVDLVAGATLGEMTDVITTELGPFNASTCFTGVYGTECGKDDTYYSWYGDGGDSYYSPDKIIETHDNWGYTAQDGTEWAIITNDKGTSFQIVGEVLPRGFIQTATLPSGWSDVKVYQDVVYIVKDVVGGGIQVFDLTRLEKNAFKT